MRAEQAREVSRRWPGRDFFTVLLVGVDEGDEPGLRAGLDSMDLVRGGPALSALVRFTEIDPDAVIMDAHVREVDPAEWISALREISAVPVVVGTEQDSIELAGRLLTAGASGIIQHPFDCGEILTRLREWQTQAVRRRRDELRLEVGPLQLDSPAFTVRLRGREISLTLKEFELLRCLMHHADRVVTLDEIHDDLWGHGPDAPSLDAIKLHLSKLRHNLGDPALVRTVRGQGYTVSHLRDGAGTAG